MISHLIISIECVKLNTLIRVFIDTGLFIILHSHRSVRIGNIYFGSFEIALIIYISLISCCQQIHHICLGRWLLVWDIIAHKMISHLIIRIEFVNLNTLIRVFIETGLFIILHSHRWVRIGNIYLGTFEIALIIYIGLLSCCYHIHYH